MWEYALLRTYRQVCGSSITATQLLFAVSVGVRKPDLLLPSSQHSQVTPQLSLPYLLHVPLSSSSTAHVMFLFVCVRQPDVLQPSLQHN